MTAAVGARNLVKVDAGVIHALLQARYYDGSKGGFLSEDPVFWGFSPHAYPPRTPCPLLVTPPFVGERFIHPKSALQMYPVRAASVIDTLPLLAFQLTQPPLSLHA
jgi:hypothetical protein